MIYLDNAATSFPKPATVYDAMDDFLRNRAGNPGRSGHAMAVAAQAVIDDGRRRLAALLNCSDPKRIVFALNATDAINIALKGLLQPGDHVVSTSVEHNAVVRPLTRLQRDGVAVTWVGCSKEGLLDPGALVSAMRPETRLVVMTHASNVCGTVQPVAAAARIAHDHGALLLVDAAQTIGCVPIDVQAMQIDVLAFPGHKALFGPPGTGGLFVGEAAEISSLREGGTGSASESPEHPTELPERLEAGTLNSVGIAGLAAGLRFIEDTGIDSIHAHECALSEMLWRGLEGTPGLTLYGPADANLRTGIVTFTLDGWEPSDVGAVLDSSFGIAVRPGLHCAPLAHRTLGTLPGGTVRMSCGLFNTEDEIQQAISAVKQIAGA